jgi:hypothetical protein
MPFGPAVRRLVLVLHIGASVGWMGAVAGFIALDVATVTGSDPATLRAAYIGMDLMTRAAIVPLAAVAVVTGIAIGLGTAWGLVRHYWVLLSLLLTAGATLVLLVQLPVIAHRADVARDPATTDAALDGLGNLLLHSVGGLVVLAIVLVLNVYKPRGLTPYGHRREMEERQGPQGRPPDT